MHIAEIRIDEALAAVGNEVGNDVPTRALIGEMIVATERWFRVIANHRGAEVAAAMDALMNFVWPVRPNSFDDWGSPRPDWREPLSMQNARWRWSEHFRMFRDFAQDGQIWPQEYKGVRTEHSSELPALFERAEGLLSIIPREWIRHQDITAAYHSMWIVLGKARARYRLDSGEDLLFHEVVLLSGMNPKSVRNATQERHGASRLVVGDQDTVTNQHALAWLKDRRTFTPTPGSNADTKGSSGAEIEDFIFIPVDEQGHRFDPETALRPPPAPSYEYAIGGDSVYVNKYMSALAALQSASVGYWRRSDGKWVTGHSWQRVPRSDLRRIEKKANEHRLRLLSEYDEINRRLIDQDQPAEQGE